VTRIAGTGDPRRTMALLWRSPAPPDANRPGPRASLTVDAIVDAAIVLADEAGDGRVSLRAVAARLGCTPMALYTYVADRRELLDLMYDRVHAPLPEPAGDDWRARVGAWSGAILECYLRHPWVVEVSFARSVLGPHEQRALELLLDALAPAGLDVADTTTLVAALFGLARSTSSTIADARRAAEAGDEGAWWAARTSALNEMVPDFAERFPRAVALAGEPDAGATDRATKWTTQETADGPWLEQPARDAFARAVAMLLDGAAPSRAPGR
jgi:AcrR family transcriptional regulator